ncbi:MAG: hypothetical protein ACRDSI_01290 [Pseudonocardiaceae bacterium]
MRSLNVGQFALHLDRLLADPAEWQTWQQDVAARRQRVPLAYRDQLAAAARDTEALTARLVATGDVREAPQLIPVIPDWIRLGLLDTYAAWALDQGSTCMHSPTVDRPGMVFCAAHKPRLVVCAHCIFLLQARPGTVADKRCDCCGRVTHKDAALRASAFQWGALTFLFAECRDCGTWST